MCPRDRLIFMGEAWWTLTICGMTIPSVRDCLSSLGKNKERTSFKVDSQDSHAGYPYYTPLGEKKKYAKKALVPKNVLCTRTFFEDFVEILMKF